MRNVDVLKSNGINIEQSLEYLGDMEMYDETLEEFLLELDNRVNDMKNFVDENDLSNYAILVHALKSDSKYLGFEKLADMSLQHELNSKDGNTNYIEENFSSLINEIENIKKISNEYLN